MANEAVLKYLQDTNRPYSCTDVTANLRGAYNKSAVQRALDVLSESGQIRCKLYGKQKVYVAIQKEQQGDEVEVGDLDLKLQNVTKDLSQASDSLRSLEAKLRSLTSLPTNEQAGARVRELRSNNEKARCKLHGLKTSTGVVSEEEKAKILGEHGALYKEYRKRKAICTQMLEAILEGYPKSKKDLIEELCMETDEMVNFVPTSR